MVKINKVKILPDLLRNPFLGFGLLVLIILLFFSVIGPFLVTKDSANVGSFDPLLRPSKDHLLGTDSHGRDLLTVLTLATPVTFKIGIIAGFVGISIGVILGLIAGYIGGLADTIIRILADVLLTIPGLLILVVVTAYFRSISSFTLALVIAFLAWSMPTRTIRAQTLSLRERGYIPIAKLNGLNNFEIIIKEILPNLLPYIAASLVDVISWAILTTIGLEVLGLGSQNEFTLGMMIFWSRFYGAIFRGIWWWWGPPIIMIVLIFMGLFFTSTGIDQIINSKLRVSE